MGGVSLGIIPAKGPDGSTRVMGKNLRDLGGKPLVAWTIEAAMAAGLTRVVVSTESAEVRDVASRYGCEVLDRPAALALPKAETHDVAVHAVETMAGQGFRPETVVLLPPTSPFRTAAHIREAVALYHRTGRNVVSVGPRLPVHLVHLVSDGRLSPVVEDCRIVNVAIWVASSARLLADRKFETLGAEMYEMDAMDGLDIDYEHDFAVAEWHAERMAHG